MTSLSRLSRRRPGAASNASSVRRTILLMSAALAIAAPAFSQPDRVRTLTGTEAGEIVASTRDGVTLERDGERVEVPIDELRRVTFGGEPATLAQARINFENGGYQTALEKLEEIDADDLGDPLIEQDVRYYAAAGAARLAIAGRGDAVAAGRALTDFLRRHGDSFHYFGAVETMGDLLVSMDRVDRAVKTYELLASTDSPALRARAGLLAGRALQSVGEHSAAIDRFDAAIGERVGDASAARLGKAVSLAASDRVDRALEILREVIRRCDEEDEALRAAAYNALGRCHAVAGREIDALLAYLHTDLLFSGDADTHAEALYHLATLWRDAGKPDDADEALAKLRRRYSASVWANRAARQR